MIAYRSQLIFFSLVLFLVVVLGFFVFKPFFPVIFLAVVFSVVFNPLYKKVLSALKNKKNLASIFMMLLIFLIIILPVAGLGFLMVKDAQTMYLEATNNSGDANIFVNKTFDQVTERIVEIYPSADFDFRGYAKKGAGILVKNIGLIFSSTFTLLLDLFLFILALFFLFRDGDKLKKRFIELSPLLDTHDNAVLDKLEKAVNSVVRGALLVAITQGIVSGIGFSIFGLPNPVFWGAVTIVSALIPVIGTSLINIPAVIFLFLSGNLFGAVGLLVWAIVAVGLVDNLLGPIFMKRGINIHPFLILLSVLGGLSFFGPIGIIAGPVTLSLLFALFDIYPLVTESNNNK